MYGPCCRKSLFNSERLFILVVRYLVVVYISWQANQTRPQTSLPRPLVWPWLVRVFSPRLDWDRKLKKKKVWERLVSKGRPSTSNVEHPVGKSEIFATLIILHHSGLVVFFLLLLFGTSFPITHFPLLLPGSTKLVYTWSVLEQSHTHKYPQLGS